MTDTETITGKTIEDEMLKEHFELSLKKLNGSEKVLFLKAIEEQGEDMPTGRIPELTFRRYFSIVSIAGAAMGIDMANLSAGQQFEIFGSLAMLRTSGKVNLDSAKTFDDFVEKMRSAEGYPWHILNNATGAGIILIPIKDTNGYYFTLSVGATYSSYILVKAFLALKEANVPIFLCNAKEIAEQICKN